MRAVTIVHVAEKAGVSLKTVSRVLNNEPNVTPQTRDRVMAAVDELGYSPSMAARRMGGSRSYLLIAFNDRQLTLDNWRSERGNNWIDQMLYGAMLRCERSGYHLLFELIDLQSDGLERRVTAILSSLQPDGVILTPPNSENETVLRVLRKREIPFVRVGSSARGAGHKVYMDDRAAGEAVTRHLLELGHRKIGFISGSPRFQASLQRAEGYATAMAASGVNRHEAWVQPGDFTYESGLAAADALLALEDRPTAIMASNDEMALAALHVAQRLGIAVPADLSIVSFDDSPGVRFSVPPLTAVRQPTAEMAERAADILIAASAEGGKPATSRHQLPFELIVRGSSGRAN